jgi:hypothetical protein
MKTAPSRIYVLPFSRPGCKNTALKYRVIPGPVCCDCPCRYRVA